MKLWLKQQVTEFTAWCGLLVCISSVFAPTWVTFSLGVLLISIDDDVAAKWAKKIAPFAQRKIDQVDEVL